MFNRKYIFKGSIFHCYVRLPECKRDINTLHIPSFYYLNKLTGHSTLDIHPIHYEDEGLPPPQSFNSWNLKMIGSESPFSSRLKMFFSSRLKMFLSFHVKLSGGGIFKVVLFPTQPWIHNVAEPNPHSQICRCGRTATHGRRKPQAAT